MVSPRADAVDGLDHAQVGNSAGASRQEILARGVAYSRRMRGQGKSTRDACLQEALDAVKMLQNQLVACIQFDAWLTVDAFCVQLCAKPALRP